MAGLVNLNITDAADAGTLLIVSGLLRFCKRTGKTPVSITLAKLGFALFFTEKPPCAAVVIIIISVVIKLNVIIGNKITQDQHFP